MYGFDKTRVIAAALRVLNSNYDLIAAKGSYFEIEDIEKVEVWYIGIRIKFHKGIVPGRRFTMLSKAAVCAKAAPSKKQVMFLEGGRKYSDRLHVSTYKFIKDESGEEHTWTTSIGYDSKAEAQAMKDWLWKQDKAAHALVRKGERTSGKWELKIWELHPQVLEEYIQSTSMNKESEAIPEPIPEPIVEQRKLITVIKPNGAYRFMLGDEMLVAVYTKGELKYEVTEHLLKGFDVHIEDPHTNDIYIAKLVGEELKYTKRRNVA